MTKGMPKDAVMATRMAVDADGSRLAASGISIVAVAVLLISAERNALAKQSIKSSARCGTCSQGTTAAAAFTTPDC